MLDMKCVAQKAMDMHIRVRAQLTLKHQVKQASVHELLVSRYKSLAAAPSGSDNAVYGREDRV